MSARAHQLLAIADDELILGWRDSEWTGIAPSLEEDVAFSSIAQNEIGHARALYELAARDLGTTADELAFDRKPEEYRCCELVELRLPEWERTIARHVLYEEADEARLKELMASDDPEVTLAVQTGFISDIAADLKDPVLVRLEDHDVFTCPRLALRVLADEPAEIHRAFVEGAFLRKFFRFFVPAAFEGGENWEIVSQVREIMQRHFPFQLVACEMVLKQAS